MLLNIFPYNFSYFYIHKIKKIEIKKITYIKIYIKLLKLDTLFIKNFIRYLYPKIEITKINKYKQLNKPFNYVCYLKIKS